MRNIKPRTVIAIAWILAGHTACETKVSSHAPSVPIEDAAPLQETTGSNVASTAASPLVIAVADPSPVPTADIPQSDFFVDSEKGSDEADGKIDTPIRTIEEAFRRRVSFHSMEATIYVAEGTYVEGALAFPPCTKLRGGWEPDFVNQVGLSVIRPEEGRESPTLLLKGALGESLIEGFEIRGSDGAKNSIAVSILGATGYTLSGNRITGGKGAESSIGVWVQSGDQDSLLKENEIEGGNAPASIGIEISWDRNRNEERKPDRNERGSSSVSFRSNYAEKE